MFPNCRYDGKLAVQPDELGDALRYHRERARLSRRQLSALSGISETAIYDVEHGKETVKLQTLLPLLDTLNLSLRLDGPLMDEFTSARGHLRDHAAGGGTDVHPQP